MKGRLLLVEDEDAIRTIAAISLERIGGWSVTPVASGHAALDAARAEEPFDVVLMDVMMPGIDGPATLARLREGLLADEVPVVFLTAKLGDGERERLLALGAAGMIAKPFDPMTLADELQQLLER
jgi:two-component system, OmpR family, response regulator